MNTRAETLFVIVVADPVCGLPPSGIGAGRPTLIGVETTRAVGRTTVCKSEKRSSAPIAAACTPKDVNVVQHRRDRCAQETSSKLSANIGVLQHDSVCCYGHQKNGNGRRNDKKIGRAFTRPEGTLSTPKVSFELFWRIGLRNRRLRRCCCTSSGLRRWLRSRRRSCRCRHARLRVINIDNWLGDIHSLASHEHRTLRPRLRGIDNHPEPILLSKLHDHGSHLLQNPVRNLLLLRSEFLLRILHRTIE